MGKAAEDAIRNKFPWEFRICAEMLCTFESFNAAFEYKMKDSILGEEKKSFSFLSPTAKFS